MTAINQVLQERGSNYGPFSGHAKLVQQMEELVRFSPGSNRLSYSQREAIHMILHKIARIVNGNPDYADSWVDIAGYAQLIVNELMPKE